MQRRRPPLVLLGCLALAVYFGYHAAYGSHGLQARSRLVQRSGMLERDIHRLEATRARLQRDVALLAANDPDADFVATIAAEVLGYVPRGAWVVAPGR